MLYLVSHTASMLGEKLHHGDIDASLAPKGIASVGPISKLFREQKLTLIVTPSVSRNSETATLLASLTGAHIFVDEGLRSWKQGAFSGWPKERAEAAIKVYLHHPGIKVPQGESANHFLKRWKRAFFKYQGMSEMGKLDIALILNSLSINAVAAKFKTVDMSFAAGEGEVYAVTPGLKLEEL